jgi:hypothetical protein
MTDPSHDDITLRPMGPGEDDLERFRRCFEDNGSPRSLEELRWQYHQTPEQALYVDFAIAGSLQLAAIYATFPVRFWIDGRDAVAVQSLNTLTDEAFRGKGLFVRSAESVFDRCAEQGVAFVYGFPNAHSARGFFDRLQWRRLDPVPFLIKPLKANYFLERLGPTRPIAKFLPSIPLSRTPAARLGEGYHLTDALEFDDRYDRLWETFAARVRVAIRRDHRYLTWRFIEKPGEDYRLLALWTKSGDLAAYVVYTSKTKHGGRIGYVMECIHDPAHEQAAVALLRHSLNAMARAGCDAVLAWNFDHAPNHSLFTKTHFMPMPEKLRPIELHFGVRPLAWPEPEVLFNREGWYISYCDSDTV